MSEVVENIIKKFEEEGWDLDKVNQAITILKPEEWSYLRAVWNDRRFSALEEKFKKIYIGIEGIEIVLDKVANNHFSDLEKKIDSIYRILKEHE